MLCMKNTLLYSEPPTLLIKTFLMSQHMPLKEQVSMIISFCNILIYLISMICYLEMLHYNSGQHQNI